MAKMQKNNRESQRTGLGKKKMEVATLTVVVNVATSILLLPFLFSDPNTVCNLLLSMYSFVTAKMYYNQFLTTEA